MEATKANIKQWKESGFRPVSVPFEDGKEVYFRSPNRKQLKLIFSKAGNGGPIAMTESFVANCYLAGDITKEQILNEDNTVYVAQLAATIDDLLGTKKAAIKKL